MNRKWILLNLALLALAAWLGWTLRQRWIAGEARQRAIFDQLVRARPVMPPPPIATPATVMATQYLDVASRMLFASDRNPNVIITAPPPPPPPPPMPALPSYYGQFQFGQPAVLLAAGNTAQKSYHAGDKIGPFEIVSFDREKITFKWNEQSVVRKVDELKPTEGAVEIAATQTQAVVQVTPGSQPSVPIAAKALGNSSNLGGDRGSDTKVGDTISGTEFKTCVPGDTTPAGTVVGGYRKVVNQTLMGKGCMWEQVAK